MSFLDHNTLCIKPFKRKKRYKKNRLEYLCGRNGVHAARPSGSIWQCIFVETITPTSQTKSLLPRYPTSFPMTSAEDRPMGSELELYSECKRRVYERGKRGEESRTWGWITLPWLLGYEDNPLAPKQGLPLLWKTPMKSTAKKWNKNKSLNC